MRAVKAIAKNFVNLLYPLHCLGCGKPLEALNEMGLCDKCISSIKHNAMPPIELEGSRIKAYSACLYEGLMKELIHLFKYKGKIRLAKAFSKNMTDYAKKEPAVLCGADIMTVVPLHKKRLREREFNQSLLLTDGLAKEFSIPVKNMLEKIRPTKYQNELLKSERAVNLKGAFRVRPEADIRDRKIILIDDVMTTGYTLYECGQALLYGGAREVTCFTLARALIGD